MRTPPNDSGEPKESPLERGIFNGIITLIIASVLWHAVYSFLGIMAVFSGRIPGLWPGLTLQTGMISIIIWTVVQLYLVDGVSNYAKRISGGQQKAYNVVQITGITITILWGLFLYVILPLVYHDYWWSR